MTTLKPEQKLTRAYRVPFELGQADASTGNAFSRYVLQHGEVRRVDWRGRAHALNASDPGEEFFGRAYVEGCCSKR